MNNKSFFTTLFVSAFLTMCASLNGAADNRLDFMPILDPNMVAEEFTKYFTHKDLAQMRLVSTLWRNNLKSPWNKSRKKQDCGNGLYAQIGDDGQLRITFECKDPYHDTKKVNIGQHPYSQTFEVFSNCQKKYRFKTGEGKKLELCHCPIVMCDCPSELFPKQIIKKSGATRLPFDIHLASGSKGGNSYLGTQHNALKMLYNFFQCYNPNNPNNAADLAKIQQTLLNPRETLEAHLLKPSTLTKKEHKKCTTLDEQVAAARPKKLHDNVSKKNEEIRLEQQEIRKKQEKMQQARAPQPSPDTVPDDVFLDPFSTAGAAPEDSAYELPAESAPCELFSTAEEFDDLERGMHAAYLAQQLREEELPTVTAPRFLPAETPGEYSYYSDDEEPAPKQEIIDPKKEALRQEKLRAINAGRTTGSERRLPGAKYERSGSESGDGQLLRKKARRRGPHSKS